MSNTARRYNKGKNRYALIPPEPLKYLAEVYTKGAHKYSIYKDKEGKQVLGKDIPLEEVPGYELIDDASDNWRKGFKWLETLDSVERHIEAFKAGEDFDEELGTYHLANAAWGLFTLLDFYKSYPQGDNRYIKPQRNWGFDVDEVICNWVEPWCEKYGKQIPTTWYFEWDTLDKFKKLNETGELSEFYLNLPPKINPVDIPVEPTCYISHRPVPDSVTKQWLENHGFTLKPVIHVQNRNEKVEVAKQYNLDFFVDDNYDTYLAMNKAGICCYLLDAQHNRRYKVPAYRRIKSLKDIPV